MFDEGALGLSDVGGGLDPSTQQASAVRDCVIDYRPRHRKSRPPALARQDGLLGGSDCQREPAVLVQ